MNLYLVASPFQFFMALNKHVAQRSRSCIVALDYNNDRFDYKAILSELKLNDCEYIRVPATLNAGGALNTLHSAFNLYLTVKKLNVAFESIYIGDASCTPLFLCASRLGKIAGILGDGASVVFDSFPATRFVDKWLFSWALGANRRSLLLAQDRRLFRRDWPIFYRYSQLPVENELWIFGSTIFLEPLASDVTYNVRISLSSHRPKDNATVFSTLQKFSAKQGVSRVRYFPHRAETNTDDFQMFGGFSTDRFFSEIRPLMYGYLPRVIISTSTTLLSFCNMERMLKRGIQLRYLPLGRDVDMIFDSYGAVSV
jgi:hypothetical protein